MSGQSVHEDLEVLVRRDAFVFAGRKRLAEATAAKSARLRQLRLARDMALQRILKRKLPRAR